MAHNNIISDWIWLLSRDDLEIFSTTSSLFDLMCLRIHGQGESGSVWIWMAWILYLYIWKRTRSYYMIIMEPQIEWRWRRRYRGSKAEEWIHYNEILTCHRRGYCGFPLVFKIIFYLTFATWRTFFSFYSSLVLWSWPFNSGGLTLPFFSLCLMPC